MKLILLLIRFGFFFSTFLQVFLPCQVVLVLIRFCEVGVNRGGADLHELQTPSLHQDAKDTMEGRAQKTKQENATKYLTTFFDGAVIHSSSHLEQLSCSQTKDRGLYSSKAVPDKIHLVWTVSP